jgi:hypothetical protein
MSRLSALTATALVLVAFCSQLPKDSFQILFLSHLSRLSKNNCCHDSFLVVSMILMGGAAKVHAETNKGTDFWLAELPNDACNALYDLPLPWQIQARLQQM